MIPKVIAVIELTSGVASLLILGYVLLLLAMTGVASRFGYDYFKRIDYLGREISFAAIYLPMSSALAAFSVSIGVNLLTGDQAIFGAVFGAAFCVAGTIAIFQLGRQAAKDMAGRSGLHSIRSRLVDALGAKSQGPTVSPQYLDELEVGLVRIMRVAARLGDRARSLGFLTWLRWRGPLYLTKVFLFLQIPFALFPALAIWGLIYQRLVGRNAVLGIGAICAAVFLPLLYLGCLVILWRTYRRMCSRASTEFEANAKRALVRIVRLRAEALLSTEERSRLESPSRVETILEVRIARWSFGLARRGG